MSDSAKAFHVRFVPLEGVPSELYVDENPVSVPGHLKRKGLSEVVNHMLNLATWVNSFDPECLQAKEKTRKFQFYVDGVSLRSSVNSYARDHAVSEESVITIHYAPAVVGESTHPDWVSCLDGSQGSMIAAGCYDCSVSLYHVPTDLASHPSLVEDSASPALPLIYTLPMAHEAPICAVAVVHDTNIASQGFHLLTAGKDHVVKLWSGEAPPSLLGRAPGSGDPMQAPDCQGVFIGHSESVEAIAVSPNGQQFASGSWDKSVSCWRLPVASNADDFQPHPKRRKLGRAAITQHAPVCTMRGHTQTVSCVAWVDDQTILSGSWDHTLRTWDAARATPVAVYSPKSVKTSTTITDLSVCPSQHHHVATSHSDGPVRLWDTRESAAAQHAMLTSQSWSTGVSWAPRAQGIPADHCLCTSDHGGFVSVWDVRVQNKPITTHAAHSDKALCVDWCGTADPQNSRPLICSGGADTRLAISRSGV